MMAAMQPSDASAAALRNDALIDRGLIRTWLGGGFAWLLVFPTLGAVVSTKFNFPESLGGVPWLSFGGRRRIHVNGVIGGAFWTLFIGLCHYVAPRLCGVRLWAERWSHGLLWVWNLNLALGSLLLAAGFNRGWEAGEYPLITATVMSGYSPASQPRLKAPPARSPPPP